MKKLVLLLFITACGFNPIYKNNNISGNSQNYSHELAAIKIKVKRDRLNQHLQNNLEKILNPDELIVDKKYLLTIDINKTTYSTFLTSTGSSGRNKVSLSAIYHLSDIKSGNKIASETTSANDDFDVGDKRFANYITEESIAENLTIIIAQNIRNLLINDIVNNYKSQKVEKIPTDINNQYVGPKNSF